MAEGFRFEEDLARAGTQVNVVLPLGPERTLGRGAGGGRRHLRSRARGLRSRFYDRGRLSVRREGGVHHFHGLLAAALL